MEAEGHGDGDVAFGDEGHHGKDDANHRENIVFVLAIFFLFLRLQLDVFCDYFFVVLAFVE